MPDNFWHEFWNQDKPEFDEEFFQVSAPPLAWKAASLIEKETEVSYEGKLQITSTKFQINLKSQYPITETHFHAPGGEGYFDLASTIEQRYLDLKLW